MRGNIVGQYSLNDIFANTLAEMNKVSLKKNDFVDKDSFAYVYETLNDEQKNVMDGIIRGENIFLTGNAGTGKSYVVKAFDKYCEEKKISIIKTAPTGISSNNIDGATLHHQFKLKTGIDLDVPTKYPKSLDYTDVLLIDEISMVRLDTFDRLLQILQLANSSRMRKKKRPIQLILVGDFYQLAPVFNKGEKPLLDEHYGMDIKEGYCFQSKFWHVLNIKMYNLTAIMRQNDVEFCKALDKCKRGDISCLGYIRSHTSKTEIPNAIWVCGKNATVSKKNEEELQKIGGQTYSSVATYHGECSAKDKLCDEVFEYKIGARVVMLANDNSNYAYSNGSTGTILSKAKDHIKVRLDSGNVVKIEKQKIAKYEYTYKDKVEEVEQIKNGKKVIVEKKVKKLTQKEIGYAKQYPMRLGYAVTIHKSQGQTYDSMNLNPEIFSTGQLYVALSRCKSVSNLHIKGWLSNRMVMASEEVNEFYNNPDTYTFFDKKEEEKPKLTTENCKNNAMTYREKWQSLFQ